MKRNFPIAPLLIGVIVGPIAEQNYRRYDSDWRQLRMGSRTAHANYYYCWLCSRLSLRCEWPGVLRLDGGKYLTPVCPYSHRGELEKGRLTCESLLFKGLT